MVVLHCGRLLGGFAGVLFLAKLHHVVICFGRQDADEGHQPPIKPLQPGRRP